MGNKNNKKNRFHKTRGQNMKKKSKGKDHINIILEYLLC